MQNIHIGTSGWTYSDWVGTFYPREVKAADRLAYYTTQFDTLEINASFYRLPSETTIAAWNRQLPDDYHLVLKGWRQITHLKRLVDCREDLDLFLRRVLPLRSLRVLLWQLAPSIQHDLPRLDAFLAMLPGQVRHAVEFRHASWWDEEVAARLANFGAGFVAVSYPRLPATIYPAVDWLYVRFHGLGKQAYHYDYSRTELSEWAERVRPHLIGREIYAFFNNGYDGNAPRNALVFKDLLASVGLS